MIVGVDPGDKHCGLIFMEQDGMVINHETVQPRELISRVEASCSSNAWSKDVTVVVEGFQLLPGKAKFKAFDEFTVIKLIGIIQYLGHLHPTPIIIKQPSIVRRFFKGKPVPFQANTTHEQTAWQAAEHYRLFGGKPGPLFS